MSHQVLDVVIYRDNRYDLYAETGTELFNPRRHGIRSIHNDNQYPRGTHLTFAVQAGQLCLDRFTLDYPVAENRQPITGGKPWVIFGTTPRDSRSGFWIFEGVNHPLTFTGGLLLNYNVVQVSRFHHNSRQSQGKGLSDGETTPRKPELFELVFQEGRLTAEIDCSPNPAEALLRFGHLSKDDDLALRNQLLRSFWAGRQRGSSPGGQAQ